MNKIGAKLHSEPTHAPRKEILYTEGKSPQTTLGSRALYVIEAVRISEMVFRFCDPEA